MTQLKVDLARAQCCPFCDSKKLEMRIEATGLRFVRCNDCRTRGPHSITTQRALDGWNSRGPNAHRSQS